MDAETAYIFRHALLREVAYTLHLPSERAQLHGTTADILEQAFAQPELDKLAFELAAHCQAAGLAGRELGWLRIAASGARRDGQPERALAAWQRVAEHPDAEPTGRLSARLHAANLKVQLGRESDAIDELAAVVQEAGEIHAREMQADALIDWASLVLARGQVEESADALQRALSINRELGRSRHLASTLGALSIHAAHVGNPGLGEDLSRQALAIYEQAGDADGVARVRVRLAYSTINNAQESEELLKLAQELAEERGDKRLQIAVWLGLSTVAQRRSDWAQAEECRRRAYDLAVETGSLSDAAGILDQIGGAMRMQGRFAEAEPLHLQALELLREIGDDRRIGIGLLNYAGLRKRMGMLEEAADAYELMLTHLNKCRDVRILGHGLGNYAELLHKLGRLEESDNMFAQALERLQQSGDRLVHAVQQGRYAVLLKRLGRDVQADSAYGLALTALTECGNMEDVASTRAAMREICAELGVAEPKPAGSDSQGS